MYHIIIILLAYARDALCNKWSCTSNFTRIVLTRGEKKGLLYIACACTGWPQKNLRESYIILYPSVYNFICLYMCIVTRQVTMDTHRLCQCMRMQYYQALFYPPPYKGSGNKVRSLPAKLQFHYHIM